MDVADMTGLARIVFEQSAVGLNIKPTDQYLQANIFGFNTFLMRYMKALNRHSIAYGFFVKKAC